MFYDWMEIFRNVKQQTYIKYKLQPTQERTLMVDKSKFILASDSESIPFALIQKKICQKSFKQKIFVAGCCCLFLNCTKSEECYIFLLLTWDLFQIEEICFHRFHYIKYILCIIMYKRDKMRYEIYFMIIQIPSVRLVIDMRQMCKRFKMLRFKFDFS